MTKTIEARQKIERAIIGRLVIDALKLGYTIGVHDGEEITVSQSTSFNVIMAAIMTTDEDYLILEHANGVRGWVRLVYGNDGWDVICDYTMNLEDALTGANDLAEVLSEVK